MGTRTLLALVLLPVAAVHAGVVVMKNGDRVTGSIVKKDGKNLVIKTEQFGLITTAWDQVASITEDTPVNVVLEDGTKVSGKLSTAEGKIQVAGTSAAPVSVAPAQVSAVRNADEQKAFDRLERPGWGDLWAGTASLGFAGTSGNARTLTFTSGVNAARVTRTDKTTLYFNTIRASALVNGRSADTASAVRGGVGYNRNIGPRAFLNVFNDYEYDRFQNLDLRFVLGGGAGLHVVRNERHQFDLLGGLAYNRSSFSTPLVRNAAELYWGDEYALKLTGATSLVQSFRMFHDLTNSGDYRMNFDIGAATKLSRWLTWNVSLSDRYLSRPAPGRKTNDFLYTTGIGITFAR